MRETILGKINKENPEEKIIVEAAKILREGGLVAFPTETVYGLGANALDPEAVEKIFAAKGRPSDNPLIVHIGSKIELNSLVKEIPAQAKQLMEAFWPGPLTLIFEKAEIIPSVITGGLSTVAIRLPKNPIARQIISATKLPIAAPSANVSGRPSPTKAQHVIEDLFGKIDMIIDGGSAQIGLESTVVDVTGKIPMILRPGGITKEMLEKVVGVVDVDPAITQHSDVKTTPKSPGMKYKHYAPKARVIIVEGPLDKMVETINRLVKEAEQEGKKVGIMATEQTKNQYIEGIVVSAGDRDDPGSIASNLFEILRRFDELHVDLVYAEALPQVEIGAAIMNRLEKAAGYEIIHV